MRGLCIDASDTTVLISGATYFLFENGDSHVYVSRFNNRNAHYGCFKKNRFKIIEEVKEPPDNAIYLEKDAVYRAKLIWRRPGYNHIELKHYYLIANGKNHAYFYEGAELKELCGCFPRYWFQNFVEVSVPNIETLEEPVAVNEQVLDEPELLPFEEWQQLSLF